MAVANLFDDDLGRRVLMLSAVSDPEICVYPDSDKVEAYAGFARTDGARTRLVNRVSAIVDYCDGEG